MCLFLIPSSTIFIAQLTPLSLLPLLYSPYVSLYDSNNPDNLGDLNVFPYDSDTHTPFPLSLPMT